MTDKPVVKYRGMFHMIYCGLHETLERLKVPGGWLVLYTEQMDKGDITDAMIFLPDPNYDWEVAEDEDSSPWEGIYGGDSDDYYEALERLKVPGGWLVLYTENTDEDSLSATMTFLPDPNHEWELKSEAKEG